VGTVHLILSIDEKTLNLHCQMTNFVRRDRPSIGDREYRTNDFVRRFCRGSVASRSPSPFPSPFHLHRHRHRVFWIRQAIAGRFSISQKVSVSGEIFFDWQLLLNIVHDLISNIIDIGKSTAL
jgi:hypothetical protein